MPGEDALQVRKRGLVGTCAVLRYVPAEEQNRIWLQLSAIRQKELEQLRAENDQLRAHIKRLKTQDARLRTGSR